MNKIPYIITDYDEMLKSVLSQSNLQEFSNYNVDEFQTIEAALRSDIPIVKAVAMIIHDVSNKKSSSNNYSRILNFLQSALQ